MYQTLSYNTPHFYKTERGNYVNDENRFDYSEVNFGNEVETEEAWNLVKETMTNKVFKVYGV